MSRRSRLSLAWRAVTTVFVSGYTWVAVAHLVTGGLLWVVPAYLAVGFGGAGTKMARNLDGDRHAKLFYVFVGFSVLVGALLVLFALTPRFTAWQQSRFRAILHVELQPHPPGQGRWRQFCYHTVGGAFTAASAAAVVACGVSGTIMLMMPFILKRHHHALGYIIFGMVAVLVAPWLARGATRVDLALARALLQPSGAEALARRVETLSASRAGVVDAADAERRRIERNLHDGTQQRLVSLAMKLGMARAALRDGPPEIRQAVADAHEEAKQTLSELRDFIRGLHPAVLDDLGLDAALSGIAARSPVPVRLAVHLPERPAVALETVAYFVVSEALSNVARHAAASRVDVSVCRRADALVVSIVDDGRGGAAPERGTGLRGLRQRVESVDGALHIDSPPGGPTAITVTLPCAS